MENYTRIWKFKKDWLIDGSVKVSKDQYVAVIKIEMVQSPDNPKKTVMLVEADVFGDDLKKYNHFINPFTMTRNKEMLECCEDVTGKVQLHA